MQIGRRARGHDGAEGLTIGIVVIAAVTLFVLFIAESGLFNASPRQATRIAIPGVTIGPAMGGSGPVVTSVRSNSEAQKRGVRAGDDIGAVNGHPVDDVAAIRTIVLQGSSSAPLDLHIRRGDAMWDVSLDRSEPAGEETAATEPVHVTKNSAD